MASLLALVVIVVAVSMIEHGGRLDSAGAVLRLGLFAAAQQAYHLLPMACLLGAAIACVVLARRGEFVAVQAAGVSVRFLSLVGIGVFSMFSSAGMALGEWVVPQAARSADALRPSFSGPLERRSPWVRVGDYMLHLPQVEQNSTKVIFSDPVIYRIRNDRIYEVLEGKTLTYTPHTKAWWLEAPLVHGHGVKPSAAPLLIPISASGSDLLDLTGQPRHLSGAELLSLMKRRERAGFDTTRHRVMFIQRYVHPWLGVLLFMVAAPWLLAAKRERSLAATLGVVAGAIGLVLALEQILVVLALGRKIPVMVGTLSIAALLLVCVPLSVVWHASARKRGRA